MDESLCHVVIIDDSKIDRFIIKRSLELKEVACRFAEFGKSEDAISFLAKADADIHPENIPDLIVTDMQMPGIDGYEMIKRLRAMPHLKKSRIIAVTSFNSLYTQPMSILIGADYFFDKPLSGKDLEKIASLAAGVR